MILVSLFFALSINMAMGADLCEGPTSAPVFWPEIGRDLGFCAEKNPEFAYNGGLCCRTKLTPTRNRYNHNCPAQRRKTIYCDERTGEQIKYETDVKNGTITDVLEHLVSAVRASDQQAFCTVNNGFLVDGRAIVQTPSNRIELRHDHRCVNFGTDRMALLIEWLGRRVALKFTDPADAGLKLLVGDVSAPMGGCLPGRGRSRGHISHTSGMDADIGFLSPRKGGRPSPSQFSREFDAQANLWLLQEIFENPFVCIKSILLDKKLKRKLEKLKGSGESLSLFGRHIKHARGHNNHFHIRIGAKAGAPGCPETQNKDEDKDSLEESPENALEDEGSVEDFSETR